MSEKIKSNKGCLKDVLLPVTTYHSLTMRGTVYKDFRKMVRATQNTKLVMECGKSRLLGKYSGGYLKSSNISTS